MVKAVRGAIKVKCNSMESIKFSTKRLVGILLSENSIGEDSIVSIIFSVTKDLNTYNPATALRTAGFAEVPLFCVQEAFIEKQASLILRVLVTYNSESPGKPLPVYLDGAENLRPDLNLQR
ncbi:MAG: chorismate mutase [Spirochaetes bacterium]|nr:chorismate mutase [Spirochaetota bacterium]